MFNLLKYSPFISWQHQNLMATQEHPWPGPSLSRMQSSCTASLSLALILMIFLHVYFWFSWLRLLRATETQPSLSFSPSGMYAAGRSPLSKNCYRNPNSFLRKTGWLLDHSSLFNVNTSWTTFWWAFNFEVDVDIFLSNDRITTTSSLQLLPFLKGSWILLSLKACSFQSCLSC